MADDAPPLHPDLAQVRSLLGTWSGRGSGHYPTIESFEYVETVSFSHVGKPFLRYEQRTRRLEVDGSFGAPLHAESGYWRFPAPGRVELIVSHPTGVNEIEEGTLETDGNGVMTFDLVTTSVALSGSAKSVTAVARTFRLDGDALSYRLGMAAVGLPLQDHLRAALQRTSGPQSP